MTPLIQKESAFILLGMTAVIVSISAYAGRGKSGRDFGKKSRTGYSYYLPNGSGSIGVGGIVLLYVALTIAFFLLDRSHSVSSSYPARILFHVVMIMVLYTSILALLAPYLRKRLTATASVTLWFVPNVLYFFLIAGSGIAYYNAPICVVAVPGFLLSAVMVTWMTGFLIVMGRSITAHCRYKKLLFKESRPVPDAVRQLFEDVKREMQVPEINQEVAPGDSMYSVPVISPATNTPLAIGFWKPCVVLPEKEYTEEELRLIFRHELIHMVRGDSWTKYHLLLCRALCWFLPLAGKAADRAAEDMELSCDETVLRDLDEEVKTEYGRLILSTASNAAGFTTCLSASAEGMKYRLQRILSNEKRGKGLLLIALASFLLIFGFGLVSFATDIGTMESILREEQIDLDDYELVCVRDADGNDITANHSDTEWKDSFLNKRLYYLDLRYPYWDDGETYTAEYRSETDPDGLAFTRTEHTLSFHSPEVTDRQHQSVYWVR